MPFLRLSSDTNSSRPLVPPIETTTAYLEIDPVRVRCETTTVYPKVENTRVITFDGVGRAMGGFMFVSEAITAGTFATLGDDSVRPVAVALGVDALVVLAYTIFKDREYTASSSVGPGGTVVTDRCPAGMELRAGGHVWPVLATGFFGGDLRLLGDVVLTGAPLVVASTAGDATLSLSTTEACAVATALGVAGACGVPMPVAPPSTVAPPPPSMPTFRVKVRLPTVRLRVRVN